MVVCSYFLEELSSLGRRIHIHKSLCALTAIGQKITAKLLLQRCCVIIVLKMSLLHLEPSDVV